MAQLVVCDVILCIGLDVEEEVVEFGNTTLEMNKVSECFEIQSEIDLLFICARALEPPGIIFISVQTYYDRVIDRTTWKATEWKIIEDHQIWAFKMIFWKIGPYLPSTVTFCRKIRNKNQYYKTKRYIKQ